MFNLFNKKTKKGLEKEIERLSLGIKNRDEFLEKVCRERNELKEENQNLRETGFELQKQIVELQKGIVDFTQKFIEAKKNKKILIETKHPTKAESSKEETKKKRTAKTTAKKVAKKEDK